MKEIILHEKWKVINNSIITKQIKQITKLHSNEHSFRLIAEALNLHRKTVKGYVKASEAMILLRNSKTYLSSAI